MVDSQQINRIIFIFYICSFLMSVFTQNKNRNNFRCILCYSHHFSVFPFFLFHLCLTALQTLNIYRIVLICYCTIPKMNAFQYTIHTTMNTQRDDGKWITLWVKLKLNSTFELHLTCICKKKSCTDCKILHIY